MQPVLGEDLPKLMTDNEVMPNSPVFCDIDNQPFNKTAELMNILDI